MKIGLVCRHYLSTKGGLEKYTLTLSSELVRHGHEVHVFANTGEERPGVHLHHVPMVPLSSPGKNLSFAYMASKKISGLPLDVVQSMERIWDQDIFRASDGINPVQMRDQLNERYHHVLVRRLKAAGPRRQALTFLEKIIFQKNGARFIMTNSNLVKNQILYHYQVPPEKIAVLYNSVDMQRFNPSVRDRFRAAVRERHGVGEKDLLILFAGNDFRRKGLPVLLEALAKLHHEKIRLMVAGGDPPRPYRRWAAKAGMGDRIVFLGHQKKLERLYGAADLFVLPTRYDAFANVCLEAMACGSPVITTETNGASEILANGIEGFVLESWEADELAARIYEFLTVFHRSAMGIRAAEAAKKHTMENYMHQLFDLYDRLLELKKI